MSKKNDYIVGLDIGTTKICCIIGEVGHDGQVDIIGLGQYPSRGLRKGVVVNIDGTVESIKNAVEEAELMAGCEIDSVFVGIAGGHINSLNSHGIIAAKGKDCGQSGWDQNSPWHVGSAAGSQGPHRYSRGHFGTKHCPMR